MRIIDNKKRILTVFALSILFVGLCGCSKQTEMKTDIKTIEKYLPSLHMEECYWYGEVKNPRTAGIGSSVLAMYGVAEIEEEYLEELKRRYDWNNDTSNQAFCLLEGNDFQELSIFKEKYMTSDEFTEEYYKTTSCVIELEIAVDFENGLLVFYSELANN